MIWLVIQKQPTGPRTVFQGHRDKPAPGTYDPELFEIKEWHGPIPQIHNPDDPENPVVSYDPTVDNAEWAALMQTRLDFGALADQADAEVSWLEDVIPQINTMTQEELRWVILRVAQENLRQIRAWRYLFRKLG